MNNLYNFVQPGMQPYMQTYTQPYVSPMGYYQPQFVVHVNVDVAAVIQAITESRVRAFELGQQARLLAVNLPNSGPDIVDKAQNVWGNSAEAEFIGVYDQYSYGVYDDEIAYDSAHKYFHKDSIGFGTFLSYEEAVAFAKSGVAKLRNIVFEEVPDLENDINWRQRIK